MGDARWAPDEGADQRFPLHFPYAAPCNGAANQQWTGGNGTPATHAGPIVAGVSSTLCVDDNSGSAADGTAIQLWGCNGTAAQQWTVAAGSTLRVLGKCMDVTGAGIADGTKVELYTCNGGSNQRWNLP
ncbi:ricin-type beta-trefoil lectin domain protein [Streptomyces sp. NPDC049040]|uniref:ricin-type beta-trefoil lectin domain protein n=1 Tax=Streptomyces sp. NPDC049040 TaxID=3365593 RepID=UPI003720F918